ncbi:MAG: cysteine peptidase family C39 domain-containing protein [Mobilitalea sp.]
MSIYNFDLTYIPEMKYLCFKNCVFQILEYFGMENPLQYIYTGFQPILCVYKDEFMASQKPLHACSKYSFVNEGRGVDFYEVLKHNHDQLDAKLNPIVVVDTFYLPYRTEYGKHHGAHTVILCDVQNNSVKLIDWYDTALFKGEIPIQDFYKARTSLCNDQSNPFAQRPIENAWYLVERNKIDNHLRVKIISENLNQLTHDENPNIRLELCGKQCLVFLKDTLLKYQMNSEIEKMLLMKKLHDTLFYFFSTAKLTKVYLNTVIQRVTESDITSCIEVLIKLLHKISFQSLKCSVKYTASTYVQTLEDFESLIVAYVKLQVAARESIFLKDIERIQL